MKRLFIIEDEPLMREMLSMLIERTNDLELAGTAASGDEAVAEWPEEDIDLTLLDLSLPGMAGMEVLRQLRRRSPTARILVLSGSHRPEASEEVRKAGADGFVIKGDPQKILAAARIVLSGEKRFDTFVTF